MDAFICRQPNWNIKQLLCIAMLIFICFAGIMLQSQIYMSHDVAWHVLITQRLLAGGTYSQNFMDISPPAIMYSKLPILMLLNLFHITLPVALRIYMFAVSFISLLLCWKLLNKLNGRENSLNDVVIISLSFCFFCLPVFELGQRDNMVLVFIMPWVLAYACALKQVPLSRSLRIMVSISAAAGFLIHALYFLIYLGLEGYLFCKKTGSRRLENLIILGISTLYVLSVIIHTPDYLSEVLPLVKTLYISLYNYGWLSMLASLPSLAALFTLAAFFMVKKKAANQALLNLLFCLLILLYIPFILTAKLWYYHTYLTISFTILLLSGLMYEALREKDSLSCFVLGLVLCFPLAHYVFTVDYSLKKSDIHSPISQLIQLAKKQSKGGSVYVFSAEMWSHLLIPYAQVNIASRMAPSWLALAIIDKEKTELNQTKKEKLNAIKHRQFQIMAEDLLTYQPNLIMVANHPVDFLGFFLQDPMFKSIWKDYVFSQEKYGYRIYLKKSGDS